MCGRLFVCFVLCVFVCMCVCVCGFFDLCLSVFVFCNLWVCLSVGVYL